jgi:hypothetical protein
MVQIYQFVIMSRNVALTRSTTILLLIVHLTQRYYQLTTRITYAYRPSVHHRQR